MDPDEPNRVLERLYESCHRLDDPEPGWSLMDYLRLIHTKLRESPEQRAELVFRVFSHDSPSSRSTADRRRTVTKRQMADMAQSALDLVECGARSPRVGLDEHLARQMMTPRLECSFAPTSPSHPSHSSRDSFEEEQPSLVECPPVLVQEAQAALDTSLGHTLDVFGHGSEALDHDGFIQMCQASVLYQEEAEGWVRDKEEYS